MPPGPPPQESVAMSIPPSMPANKVGP
jgi:hypothetical protein